ncbi:MAG TPA: hypothetical protein VK963_04215, partial [Candidatus Saccharimonadales bacterium]|nr:hypothetical protein [Candidatus Saccharimonadales bacterium]
CGIMKVIVKSNADEVVLEWLKAELNSERFSNDLQAAIKKAGQTDTIITSADLNDENENKIRQHILRQYREWLTQDLNLYSWQWSELSQDDVRGLQYIDYSYWNELSDNTSLVGRAAQNVSKGKVVFDVPNDRFYSVAKAVEAGQPLPPIILVSNSDKEPAEILEGHLRATGYALAKKVPYPLCAVIGTSKILSVGTQ